MTDLPASASRRAASTALAPPGTIAPYLREIGRGKEGARSLTREQAFDLMSRLLGDEISALELGGFALAMRVKGESAEELLAFVEAAQRTVMPLPEADRAILLPSYNGARKQPNLTPLLAALLAREGAPVLVHGPLLDAGRIASAEIFTALGEPPCGDADAVAARWARRVPAFVAIDVLSPPLARFLAVRRVLGLRNSAHTIVKILPALPGALRVVNHTHPEYSDSLTQFLEASGADAMLMRGTEGEPVADARRLQALTVFLGGRRDESLSLPIQEGPLRAAPVLPAAIDAATTAAYVVQVLAGELPVPEPIAKQVGALLRAREQMAV